MEISNIPEWWQSNKNYKNGDCLEFMKNIPNESIDGIVTDPPYHLKSKNSESKGFMGKEWDGGDIAFKTELWKECLRILKPGGYLIAFGGTRTYHRMVCAIEDSGFIIKDMIDWIYNTGFPKSLNIGKAVDKLRGNEREIIWVSSNEKDFRDVGKKVKEIEGIDKLSFGLIENAERKDLDITKGTSEWEGWGTALKPAHEPIVLAMKELSEKTYVKNVLKHGTGGLDIDGCKIPIKQNELCNPTLNNPKNYQDIAQNSGRFPANIVVTDDALNDGTLIKGNGHWSKTKTSGFGKFGNGKTEYYGVGEKDKTNGSKPRYFDIDIWAEKNGILQIPKASKSERNKGCEGLEDKIGGCLEGNNDMNNNRKIGANPEQKIKPVKNNHPTVKPIQLMSWLIKLISKPGDVIFDPFVGSGTTLVSCVILNRIGIGCEKEKEYIPIIDARLKYWYNNSNQKTEETINNTLDMIDLDDFLNGCD